MGNEHLGVDQKEIKIGWDSKKDIWFESMRFRSSMTSSTWFLDRLKMVWVKRKSRKKKLDLFGHLEKDA